MRTQRFIYNQPFQTTQSTRWWDDVQAAFQKNTEWIVAGVQQGTLPTLPAAVTDTSTKSARESRNNLNVEFVELIADAIAQLDLKVFKLADGNWTQVWHFYYNYKNSSSWQVMKKWLEVVRNGGKSGRSGWLFVSLHKERGLIFGMT